MDTQQIKKVIEAIKVPYLYRDIMILIYGMIGVLILHFFYTPHILDFILPKPLSLEFDFIFLALCYVIGKLLLAIGGILFKIYLVCNEINNTLFCRRLSLKQSLILLRKTFTAKIKFYMAYQYIEEAISPQDVKHIITVAQMTEITHQLPQIGDTRERAIINDIFNRIGLAILFISMFLFPYKIQLSVVFIIFFYWSIKSYRRIEQIELNIFHAAVKQQDHTLKV